MHFTFFWSNISISCGWIHKSFDQNCGSIQSNQRRLQSTAGTTQYIQLKNYINWTYPNKCIHCERSTKTVNNRRMIYMQDATNVAFHFPFVLQSQQNTLYIQRHSLQWANGLKWKMHAQFMPMTQWLRSERNRINSSTNLYSKFIHLSEIEAKKELKNLSRRSVLEQGNPLKNGESNATDAFIFSFHWFDYRSAIFLPFYQYYEIHWQNPFQSIFTNIKTHLWTRSMCMY